MKPDRYIALLLIPLLVAAASSDKSTSTTSTPTSTNKSSTSSKSDTSTSKQSASASTSSKSTASTSASTSVSTTKSSSSTSQSKSSTKKSSSSTTSMPKITATSESYTTSSFSATFTPVVPTDIGANPNIKIDTLPSGLTFIAVGSVLGLVFLGMILARVIIYFVSFKRAQGSHLPQDGNVEYFDYDPSVFQGKKHYTQSIYSLGSSSTINVLASDSSMDVSSIHTNGLVGAGTSGGGRSYRNAISKSSRNSLFISPTEMLSLPKPTAGSEWNNNSFIDSPIDSPQTAYSGLGYIEPYDQKVRKQRPPSVYLEKMFDDDLSPDSSFDSEAHEKV